ncbi:hypothetical protein GCWU000341_00286 [Oribacterium sp. oral taxon 078 str. F0262]|nr:hypothetical protein GCWU000341_00286 [Oribacterium sp. oral taxon 078 str. F0262]
MHARSTLIPEGRAGGRIRPDPKKQSAIRDQGSEYAEEERSQACFE